MNWIGEKRRRLSGIKKKLFWVHDAWWTQQLFCIIKELWIYDGKKGEKQGHPVWVEWIFYILARKNLWILFKNLNLKNATGQLGHTRRQKGGKIENIYLSGDFICSPLLAFKIVFLIFLFGRVRELPFTAISRCFYFHFNYLRTFRHMGLVLKKPSQWNRNSWNVQFFTLEINLKEW